MELCWLTCVASELNGEELTRARGVAVLGRLLQRCLAVVPADVPPTAPAAAIAANCLRAFAGMAAFPAARAELAAMRAPAAFEEEGRVRVRREAAGLRRCALTNAGASVSQRARPRRSVGRLLRPKFLLLLGLRPGASKGRSALPRQQRRRPRSGLPDSARLRGSRPALVADVVRACGLERAHAAVEAALQAITQMAALPALQARALPPRPASRGQLRGRARAHARPRGRLPGGAEPRAAVRLALAASGTTAPGVCIEPGVSVRFRPRSGVMLCGRRGCKGRGSQAAHAAAKVGLGFERG